MTQRSQPTGQMPAWPQQVHDALAQALGEQRANALRTLMGFSGAVAICSVACPAAIGAVVVDRSGAALDHVRRNYFAGWMLDWAGTSVSASGLEHLDPVRPRVYVANHQSFLDIPALHWVLPADVRMVAKTSIKWVPFLGQSMLAAGYPFVDRRDTRGAQQNLDKVAAQMNAGISILMFAEGTRTHDGQVAPFKKGAFVLALKAGVPIVPIGLAGSWEALGRGRPLRPGHIHVHIMPELPTADLALGDRDRLRDQVRGAVLEAVDEAQRLRAEHLEAAGERGSVA